MLATPHWKRLPAWFTAAADVRRMTRRRAVLIGAVAAACDLNVATLYHYFPSKEEIFVFTCFNQDQNMDTVDFANLSRHFVRCAHKMLLPVRGLLISEKWMTPEIKKTRGFRPGLLI